MVHWLCQVQDSGAAPDHPKKKGETEQNPGWWSTHDVDRSQNGKLSTSKQFILYYWWGKSWWSIKIRGYYLSDKSMWLVVSSLGFKMFATAKAQRSPQTWVLFDPEVTKHDFAAKICMSLKCWFYQAKFWDLTQSPKSPKTCHVYLENNWYKNPSNESNPSPVSLLTFGPTQGCSMRKRVELKPPTPLLKYLGIPGIPSSFPINDMNGNFNRETMENLWFIIKISSMLRVFH